MRTPRVLNCLPSPNQERDWGIHAAVGAGAVAAPRAKPPTTVDLRDDKWWPVGDQRSTGSCVGWATADGVLQWHFTNTGRIAKGDQLSVRYLWMAAKERDEFTERPRPFDPPVMYPDEVPTFYTLAARLRIATYHNLGSDPADWRTWLATQGPILTRLDCDSTWMNARATKGKLSRYDAASARGGHAVVLVGCTPTTFIVRNSWGTADWGDKGYAYANTAYARAAFTEAYGVTL